MKPIPMVRRGVLIPFVEFLEACGSPVDRLFEAARLTSDLESDPERLLPLHQVLAFLDRAARSEGLDNLGLLVGLRTRFEALGAFAHLIRGVPTLQQALNRLIDAIALYNSGDRLWLTIQGDRAMLCHAYAFDDTPGRRHGAQFALAMMVAAIRAVLGAEHWLPDEIRLPSHEAGSRTDIEATLLAPVICDGGVTALVFSRALLAAPGLGIGCGAEQTEDSLHFLSATAPAEDFTGSVRQAIGALLDGGYPSIHRTANAVGLSARALQRRLAERDVTYSQLLEASRFETGVRLLRESDLKLIEIAYELGYADAANFTRAFRRWTGMAPRAYRRLCAC